jgi:hypothetical protein
LGAKAVGGTAVAYPAKETLVAVAEGRSVWRAAFGQKRGETLICDV